MANSNEVKKYHFIYKTTNLTNGNFYIGMHSTSNLDDGYLGSGKRLLRSIKKYGTKNFSREILEFLPDRFALIIREAEIVNNDLLKEEKCINLMPGGAGGFISPEQQAHRSQCGIKAFKKKLIEDENFRAKISMNNSKTMKKINLDGKMRYDNFKGKKHSEETKLKMRKQASKRTGEKNSRYGKCWIYNLNLKENKCIPKSEIDKWLQDDWIKGRKMNFM